MSFLPNINYTDTGNGKTVVFLHGWGGGLASFAYAVHCLQHQYRVVNLQFPSPTEVWGVENYASWVLELLAHLGVEQCYLVGHSFGGRVAVYLSAHYSHMVKGLVLVSSAGLKPRRGLRYYFKVHSFKLKRRLGFNTSNSGSADYRQLPDTMKQTFTRVVNQNLLPLTHQIKCDTLIVWGKKDKDTPAYMARRFNKNIKNSQIVWLEGGHYAYVEEYTGFVRLVKGFIK